jgi:uncharacterized membrane protein HdeD (DUF308 family)
LVYIAAHMPDAGEN